MSSEKKILIVEDEFVIAENSKILIEECYNNATVKIAMDAEETSTVLQGFLPDLALLDIRLGQGKDGIDLSEELSDRNIPFLFVTSHGDPDTVSKALKTKPIGYVIKPVTKQNLYANLELAFSKIQSEKLYVFKDGTHDVRLPEKEIVFLKADGNYTELHTETQRYVIRKSMKKMLEEIQTTFLQTHRSYFVNPDFIRETNEQVYLTNGNQIPLSRSYKKQVLKELFNK